MMMIIDILFSSLSVLMSVTAVAHTRCTITMEDNNRQQQQQPLKQQQHPHREEMDTDSKI